MAASILGVERPLAWNLATLKAWEVVPSSSRSPRVEKTMRGLIVQLKIVICKQLDRV
jgi:hypothetical protein